MKSLPPRQNGIHGDHTEEHEDAIVRFAYGESNRSRAQRLLVTCDRCMALGYRLCEDALALNGNEAPYPVTRLETLLEEALLARAGGTLELAPLA